MNSPFPAGPFDEDELLRRPFQQTPALALGKKKGVEKWLEQRDNPIYWWEKRLLFVNINERFLLERSYLIVDSL